MTPVQCFVLLLGGWLTINAEGRKREAKTQMVGAPVSTTAALPYQASLMYNTQPANKSQIFCSAVIVSTQWILSAARCLCDEGVAAAACQAQVNQSGKAFTVRYDMQLLTNPGNNAQRKVVTDVIIHPNFDGYLESNLMLLKLQDPINPSGGQPGDQGVDPIQISSVVEHACPASTTTAFGWGDTSDQMLQVMPRTRIELGQLDYRIMSDIDLVNSYFGQSSVPPAVNVFCAHPTCIPGIFGALPMTTGGTICNGDEGGPVVVTLPQLLPMKATLIGVNSYYFANKALQLRCLTNVSLPNVFTEISQFATWIGTTTQNQAKFVGSICGDGRVGLSEDCDDRNRVSGDGCSDTCRREEGWVCSPSTNYDLYCSPSTCFKLTSATQTSDQMSILGVSSSGPPNTALLISKVSEGIGSAAATSGNFPSNRIQMGTPEQKQTTNWKVPVALTGVTALELAKLQRVFQDKVPQPMADFGVKTMTPLATIVSNNQNPPSPSNSSTPPVPTSPTGSGSPSTVSSEIAGILGGLIGGLLCLLCYVSLICCGLYWYQRQDAGMNVTSYAPGGRDNGGRFTGTQTRDYYDKTDTFAGTYFQSPNSSYMSPQPFGDIYGRGPY